MRILFLINAYPPDFLGGFEIRCHRTTDALRSRGHDVRVLTSYLRANGPDVASPVYRTLRSKLSEDPSRSPMKWVRVFRHNARQYREVLREFQPQVVCDWHLEWCTAEFAHYVHSRHEGPPVLKFGGGAIARSPKDMWTSAWESRRGAGSWAAKTLARPFAHALMPVRPRPLQYSTVCFNSEFTKAWCLSHGTLAHGTVVVNPGVDTERFRARSPDEYSSPPRFLFVGRPDPEKDPEVCLDAFAALRARGMDAHLTFVAANSASADYGALVLERARSMRDGVRVLEAVRPQDMPATYREHDVLVFPSPAEWWGNTPLEAMACGLAVVATGGGGAADFLVDGRNSLFFPAGSVEALVAAIERLLVDRLLLRRLGQKGQETATRFSFGRYVEETERLLQRVAGVDS